MTPVEDVLARFDIATSSSAPAHFDCMDRLGRRRFDIWLDPNLSDEDWQASVDDAAGSLKRPWKRGEPDDQEDACIDSHRLFATAGRDA